jgi:hypothetical protein
MRVNKYLLPLFGVVPMVALVLMAQLTGNWSTSGRAAIDMANMRPEDIKGWMTWQEVSDGLGIPLAELYALAGVSEDIPPTTALKEMEGLLEGFETTTVREVAAAYLAGETQPAQPAAGEAQPAPETAPSATPTPEAAPVATVPAPVAEDAAPAQPVATPEHVPAGDGLGDGTGPTPLPAGQVLPASEIKGRHTLAEIAQQAVVPLDGLLAALGLPAEFDPNTPVKDLVSSGAVAEIQVVRDAVAKLQAAIP